MTNDPLLTALGATAHAISSWAEVFQFMPETLKLEMSGELAIVLLIGVWIIWRDRQRK